MLRPATHIRYHITAILAVHYTKRAVMAEYRIVYYDGKIVRFSYKDYY